MAELVRHGLLAREPGRRVRIGVLDGDEVIFIERRPAPRAVIDYTRIAGRLLVGSLPADSAALAARAPER